MATIALYADKVNQMPGLVRDVRKAVLNYKAELTALKNKSLKIDQGICNMEDVVSFIQVSSQTQEEKITSLEAFQQKNEEFIEDIVRIDNEVADVIRQRKDDFYEQYDYLKPECEKNGWENFCDLCKTAGEWCREHWKIIVTVVLVVAAVVLMCTGVGGPFGAMILGACQGLIAGAAAGGILGGLSGIAADRSFFEGFESGAFSGALMGIFFGSLGGMGQMLGSSCTVLRFLGPAVKAVPVISRISLGVSLGMFGFDLLSLGISLFDRDNLLVKFNRKLHSNTLYNTLQFAVGALAVFTGGFVKGMRNPTCFVAGTMVLTAAGLTAIEHIRAGDKVISTDPGTGETAEKKVLKTYLRETDRLVHLTVNGEEIITTDDHPFYVKGRGFVKAGELWAGAGLLDVKGNLSSLEDMRQELVEEPVTVYNLQVEEFHTYHAGSNGVLVHNANYPEDVNGMQERSQAGQEAEGGAEQRPVEGSSNAGLAQYGDDFGKMGTYVKNPNIKVDWSQYAEHGFERMQQRGMTQEIIDQIVANGKVLSQNNGSRFAFITQEGVAVVSKDGKLITTWSSKYYDSVMQEIIIKLFGE